MTMDGNAPAMDDQSTEIHRERKNKCCRVRCFSVPGTERAAHSPLKQRTQPPFLNARLFRVYTAKSTPRNETCTRTDQSYESLRAARAFPARFRTGPAQTVQLSGNAPVDLVSANDTQECGRRRRPCCWRTAPCGLPRHENARATWRVPLPCLPLPWL